MKRSTVPSLRVERRMMRSGPASLAALDEVGRGALCGPVSVGAVLIDLTTRTAPQGVRDSKLLSAGARERLTPKIQRWARSSAVGHAGPEEIDRYGLMTAMRLAARRALSQLASPPDLVLLDGNYDYVSDPDQGELLVGDDDPGAELEGQPSVPAVQTLIKADLRCASVAAASILAKTARDAIMVRAAEDYPQYGWKHNKGYAADGHLAALAEFGTTSFHRRSWNLSRHLAADSAQTAAPVAHGELIGAPVAQELRVESV